MVFYPGKEVGETFLTSAGPDTVDAKGGDDWIVVYGGTDIIDGGSGDDTISFVAATRGVTVDLQKTIAQNTGFGLMTITNVEALIGSNFSDTLTGNSKNNTLAGWGGNDTLSGLGGNDWLRGGFGNDKFLGGSGTDTASFQSTESNGIRIDLRITGPQNTNEGWDTFLSIENVFGSQKNDFITGSNSNNVLDGSDGNDRLYGAGGSDTLWGGKGKDVFVWQLKDTGSDVIHDFVRGQDKIDVSGNFENNGWKFSNFRVTHANGDTIVTFKADPTLFITLNGNHALQAVDFIF